MVKDEEHVIELYELWTKIKSRFGIVSPQPKHFNLRKEVIPITSLDGYTLDFIDLTDDTQVNSGGSYDYQYLKPPKGYIYELIYVYYRAPDPDGGGASTSGTHKLNLYYDGININAPILTASSNFGNEVVIVTYGLAADSETPSGSTQQFDLIANAVIVASYDMPVTFRYYNNTDKHQVSTRTCEIIVKKRPEGAY